MISNEERRLGHIVTLKTLRRREAVSKCKVISVLFVVAFLTLGSSPSPHNKVITLYTPSLPIGTGRDLDSDAIRGLVECAVVNVSNHPIDIRITLVNLGDRRPRDSGGSDFITYQPGVIPYSSRIRPNTRLVYCKIEVRGINRKAYKDQVRGSLTWLDTTGPPGSEIEIPRVVLEAH